MLCVHLEYARHSGMVRVLSTFTGEACGTAYRCASRHHGVSGSRILSRLGNTPIRGFFWAKRHLPRVHTECDEVVARQFCHDLIVWSIRNRSIGWKEAVVEFQGA